MVPECADRTLDRPECECQPMAAGWDLNSPKKYIGAEHGNATTVDLGRPPGMPHVIEDDIAAVGAVGLDLDARVRIGKDRRRARASCRHIRGSIFDDDGRSEVDFGPCAGLQYRLEIRGSCTRGEEHAG